jgi:hypothetical protein
MVDVLSIKNEEKRLEAWEIAIGLISYGVLTYDNIIPPLKMYFLELLREDGQTLLKCWRLASYLITKGIIMPKDVKEMKEGLFELLQYKDYNYTIKRGIWKEMPNLIENKVIGNDDRSFFLEILHNSNVKIRSQLWYFLPELLKNEVLSIEDIRNMKEILFELLESFDQGVIPSSIWTTFSSLFYNQTVKLDEVITPEEIKRVRDTIICRLKHTYGPPEYPHWIGTLDLIKKNNILTVEDVTKLKDRIIYRLKSCDKEKLLFAWLAIPHLVENNVISPEDVKKVKNGLLILITDKDEDRREFSWSICQILPSLFATGILDFEDVKIIKKWLFSLLESSDKIVRSGAWPAVPGLVENNIMAPEDVKEIKKMLLKMLHGPNSHLKLQAWQVLLKLYSTQSFMSSGILTNKEIKDNKIGLIKLQQSSNVFLRRAANELMEQYNVISAT